MPATIERLIAEKWRQERDNPHASDVRPERIADARQRNEAFRRLNKLLRKPNS